jgi:Uma2 family endonuclease
MTIAPTQIYTAEEYFAQELEAETRSEFRNGEIVTMTGGTPAHNQIAGSLLVGLKLALRGKPLRVFVADQRLWIADRNIYTYPDVMVIADPLQLQPGRNDTVTNPILIAEVLSESTKNYDRTEKFAAYRTIATLQEYLLIDQYQPHVEQYSKQGEKEWLFREFDDRDAKFLLSSIAVEMALADLYEGIEF